MLGHKTFVKLEHEMKRFLAIYTASAEAMSRWKSLPEQERKERETTGLKAWQEWAARNKAAIVDEGAPLGKTKRASSEGIADIRNNMAVYNVVQAESHEEAVEIFKDHPHFTIFPGEAIEVMEFLPVPRENTSK